MHLCLSGMPTLTCTMTSFWKSCYSARSFGRMVMLHICFWWRLWFLIFFNQIIVILLAYLIISPLSSISYILFPCWEMLFWVSHKQQKMGEGVFSFWPLVWWARLLTLELMWERFWGAIVFLTMLMHALKSFALLMPWFFMYIHSINQIECICRLKKCAKQSISRHWPSGQWSSSEPWGLRFIFPVETTDTRWLFPFVLASVGRITWYLFLVGGDRLAGIPG